ncbi:MAG: 50S ribosomal protein L19 [Candidatus Omnitrophica bacterium]|nr:50S ribosomal protein L19 [Candidatus Omnitrophota bacterium]
MDPRIQDIERSQIKGDRPDFKVGDTVRVFVRIQEDDKTRIQPYEGVAISRKGGSSRETFTVRRVSYGEGVERTFYLHSPMIEKVLVVKRGHVRRAKLYYLRKKVGKAGRIEERFEENAAEAPNASAVRPEAPAPTKT